MSLPCQSVVEEKPAFNDQVLMDGAPAALIGRAQSGSSTPGSIR